jgi:hypothetical protein
MRTIFVDINEIVLDKNNEIIKELLISKKVVSP